MCKIHRSEGKVSRHSSYTHTKKGLLPLPPVPVDTALSNVSILVFYFKRNNYQSRWNSDLYNLPHCPMNIPNSHMLFNPKVRIPHSKL